MDKKYLKFAISKFYLDVKWLDDNHFSRSVMDEDWNYITVEEDESDLEELYSMIPNYIKEDLINAYTMIELGKFYKTGD